MIVGVCNLQRYLQRGRVLTMRLAMRPKTTRKGSLFEAHADARKNGWCYAIDSCEKFPVTESHIVATNEIFRHQADFIGALLDPTAGESINPYEIPEVALVGRSNVGKSTLMNALLGTKGLVKTSKHPGRTKGINYFSVGPKRQKLYLVDMPGYGFIKESKKTASLLQHRVYGYLREREQWVMQLVLLLMDGRRGGPTKADIQAMEAFDKMPVRYRVVLTKADTLTPAQLSIAVRNTLSVVERSLAADPFIHVVSGTEEWGVDELRQGVVSSVEFD